MRSTVIKHMKDRFQSFVDLANQVSEEELHQNLDVTNSKNLMTHMWCVIGARESYTKSLPSGAWTGFNCSLSEYNVASVRQALAASATEFEKTVEGISNWTDEQDELLTSLAEHEVMHEGQIIRLFHGLGHKLPESIKWD